MLSTTSHRYRMSILYTMDMSTHVGKDMGRANYGGEIVTIEYVVDVTKFLLLEV